MKIVAGILAAILTSSSALGEIPANLTKDYLVGGWAIKGETTCEDQILYMIFRPDGRWQFDMDSGTYRIVSGDKIIFDGGKNIHVVRIIDRNTYVTRTADSSMTMLRCPINWDEVSLNGRTGL